MAALVEAEVEGFAEEDNRAPLVAAGVAAEKRVAVGAAVEKVAAASPITGAETTTAISTAAISIEVANSIEAERPVLITRTIRQLHDLPLNLTYQKQHYKQELTRLTIGGAI